MQRRASRQSKSRVHIAEEVNILYHERTWRYRLDTIATYLRCLCASSALMASPWTGAMDFCHPVIGAGDVVGGAGIRGS